MYFNSQEYDISAEKEREKPLSTSVELEDGTMIPRFHDKLLTPKIFGLGFLVPSPLGQNVWDSELNQPNVNSRE